MSNLRPKRILKPLSTRVTAATPENTYPYRGQESLAARTVVLKTEDLRDLCTLIYSFDDDIKSLNYVERTRLNNASQPPG